MAPPRPQAVVFNSAVEGVRRAFGPRLPEPVRADLANIGIDLSRIVAAYRLEIWEQALQRIAQFLMPELPESERYRPLGQQFLHGYLETALGKAALGMARLVGPKVTFERMSRNFRTAVNYMGTEAVVRAEREVELRVWLLEPFLEEWANRPSLFIQYRRGILEGCLEELREKGTVEVVSEDAQRMASSYLIRW